MADPALAARVAASARASLLLKPFTAEQLAASVGALLGDAG
jgi:hypothetical protein